MSIVNGSWSRLPSRAGGAVALGLVTALTLAACSEARPLLEPTPVMTVTPEPEEFPLPESEEPPLTELRVAYINLHAPAEGDETAISTFDERLDRIISELLEFDPHLVGFSEAYWSEDTGRAASRLAGELLMEFQFVLTNPWPEDPETDPDDYARKQGFAEGHLVLSRFPILGAAESGELGPREPFEGARRTALHVIVEAPAPVGRIDVYIAQLSGGSEILEFGLADELVGYITETRGEGTLLLMGNIGSESGTLVLQPFLRQGFIDLAVQTNGRWAKATCCRNALLGPLPRVERRTDFLMTDGWEAEIVDVFADEPIERDDGSLLYASDHNGVLAVLPVTEEHFPALAANPP